jgi:hypothetical protein
MRIPKSQRPPLPRKSASRVPRGSGGPYGQAASGRRNRASEPLGLGADGLAAANSPDGKRGFIGRNGGREIAPRFRQAFIFTANGFASGEERGGWPCSLRPDVNSGRSTPFFPECQAFETAARPRSAPSRLPGLHMPRLKMEGSAQLRADRLPVPVRAGPAMDGSVLQGCIRETGALALEPRFSQASQFIEKGWRQPRCPVAWPGLRAWTAPGSSCTSAACPGTGNDLDVEVLCRLGSWNC